VPDFVWFVKGVAILSILILDLFFLELFVRTWTVGQLWTASITTSACVIGAVTALIVGSYFAVRGVFRFDPEAL
jgi:hypothetical protein